MDSERNEKQLKLPFCFGLSNTKTRLHSVVNLNRQCHLLFLFTHVISVWIMYLIHTTQTSGQFQCPFQCSLWQAFVCDMKAEHWDALRHLFLTYQSFTNQRYTRGGFRKEHRILSMANEMIFSMHDHTPTLHVSCVKHLMHCNPPHQYISRRESVRTQQLWHPSIQFAKPYHNDSHVATWVVLHSCRVHNE